MKPVEEFDSPDEPSAKGELPRLGSLAQSAREKELKVARRILLIIGILTAGFNGLLLATVRDQAKQALDAEVRKLPPGQVADPVRLQQAEDRLVTYNSLFFGALTALGVLFVVFGIIIKMYPVQVTITSLVLYILVNVVVVILEPETLAPNMFAVFVKIAIVAALAKAVQAAIAYDRERRSLSRSEMAYE